MIEAYFEHATDGIALLRPSVEAAAGAGTACMLVSRLNTAAVALLGLDAAAALGQPLEKLLPHADLKPHLDRAMVVGRSDFHIRANALAMPLPAEAVRLADGLAVTIRRQQVLPHVHSDAGPAGCANDHLIRLFIESAPAALAMFDRDLRYIACSRRWRDDYGLKGQSLSGRRHYEVFPEIPAHWKEIHARCLAGASEACEQDEFFFGTQRMVLRWQVMPWYETPDQVGGLIMMTEDITSRAEAVLELERVRNRLHDCIESLQGGIVMFDAEDRLVLCNRHHRGIYHEVADEMLPGQGYRELIEAYVRKNPAICGSISPEAFVEHRIHRHKLFREPWEQQIGDRWILIQDHDTAEGGVVSLRTDITELKRNQAELQAAKDAAEAANRAKTEFLANMSHEIRTPMTAMLGYADLLDESRISAAERRDHVQTIRRNGEHLLSIINDILDLSKIEAGQLSLTPAAVPLTGLMREVHDLMKVRADAKAITFELAPLFPLPMEVQSDPVRLRQILVNLLGNAIKFTEIGGVKLQVSHDADSGTLTCDVIDTGPGIGPEMLQTIFKPFQQADNTLTRRHGGTGLGLAISRRLAQALGGDITVTSEVGKGSTFRLTTRAPSVGGTCSLTSCGQCPVRESCRRGPVQVNVPDPQLSGRVLLVEDGPDNQRLIAFHLRKAGLKAEVAENGQEGLAKLAEGDARGEPFDLVLLDMQMPVLDGYGTVAAMRAAGDFRPVIALTAHAMSGDREKCLAAGCNEYTTKPVKKDELFAMIRTLLERQHAACGLDAA